MELYLIGLGNPGKEYYLNRHNVGFLFLDYVASKNKWVFRGGKGNFEYASGRFYRGFLVLVKPLYYMNLSGLIFRDWVELREKDFIVIYDDVDLSFGRVKMQVSGGDGGHKGLRSIIYHFGSDKFARIRIGIGRPPRSFNIKLRDWVLSNFLKEEIEELKEIFERIYSCLFYYYEGGFGKMMTHLNREKGGKL